MTKTKHYRQARMKKKSKKPLFNGEDDEKKQQINKKKQKRLEKYSNVIYHENDKIKKD